MGVFSPFSSDFSNAFVKLMLIIMFNTVGVLIVAPALKGVKSQIRLQLRNTFCTFFLSLVSQTFTVISTVKDFETVIVERDSMNIMKE